MNNVFNRRHFLLSGCSFAAATAVASKAMAMGFLTGTWIVRCPAGHDDRVDDTTRNHDCEKCGRKTVDDGTALVVCPNGHTTPVGGITVQHKCGLCGAECRR